MKLKKKLLFCSGVRETSKRQVQIYLKGSLKQRILSPALLTIPAEFGISHSEEDRPRPTRWYGLYCSTQLISTLTLP